MSLQPHVTKQPHLVGKLATPQRTHQSKQTPTRPKRTDQFPPPPESQHRGQLLQLL